MIIYNVTVGIDSDVVEEWLRWMIDEHIPKVLDTKCFVNYKIYKVLNDEEGSLSFSVQYHAENMETVLKYFDQYAPTLAKEHQEKFKNKHVAFRTLLEEVV